MGAVQQRKQGLPILGVNNVNPELKIAKFVHSTPTIWHGYPADYIQKNQDRPTLDVLMKMHSNGLITAKEMKRISKGQKV